MRKNMPSNGVEDLDWASHGEIVIASSRPCLAMVSQEFSKDTSSVHTEHIAYNLQFRPDSAPLFVNPNEEHMNNLINHEAHKQYGGVGYGKGHGLSLTLGNSENNNRVYNSMNPYNHVLNSMASALVALQSSPYMKPAQELLDEVVCVSNAVDSEHDKQARKCSEINLKQFEANCYSADENDAVHIKISKLVALLDQLESRCDYYFHQMNTVVSSFESIAGIGSASSYTALTIQAMSKHFSNLREAIITQLNSSRESLSKNPPRNQHKSGTLQQLSMVQIRQVWRPLRGLPEGSVACLRSWLFEHFLHPYPTDSEKLMLASKTGLTRNQISNWFINARVRLWKPMIEEMYKEEFAEDMEE